MEKSLGRTVPKEIHFRDDDCAWHVALAERLTTADCTNDFLTLTSSH